jgi:error-prone DNA polymerase
MVVCRQRPQTARGIVFLLLEDEFGMVNVVVNQQLDNEQAALVRTSMFLEVDGVLEKRAGEQRTIVAQRLREIVPAEALLAPAGKSWA